MKIADVVSLDQFRRGKGFQVLKDHAYEAVLANMSKTELLEEMVRYQSKRASYKDQEVPLNLMIRGKSLFKALSQAAETRELKILTQSYRKHLDLELEQRFKKD